MKRDSVHVLPRWLVTSSDTAARDGMLTVRLVDGCGFGDGTHPTTALCLQALAALAPRGRGFRLLDFGSGSGILSVAAAAHLGAVADAVEIDALAIDHAARNIRANGVDCRVRQLTALGQASGPYDVVVANILRSVLLSFAEPLVSLLAPSGVLVLSGLVSTDTPEVGARYTPLLGSRPEIYEREEWRALVWKRNWST